MDSLSWGMIFLKMAQRFLPVWIALIVTFTLSIRYKRRLGLYGKLFDSPVGMTGFAIVMFWVFTAIFADLIVTYDPIAQLGSVKNPLPGTPVVAPKDGAYPWFLLGGDHLARDIFSRMVMGARRVLVIAPAATTFDISSASPWACPPAITAASSTPACRSCPTWCWRSR